MKRLNWLQVRVLMLTDAFRGITIWGALGLVVVTSGFAAILFDPPVVQGHERAEIINVVATNSELGVQHFANVRRSDGTALRVGARDWATLGPGDEVCILVARTIIFGALRARIVDASECGE